MGKGEKDAKGASVWEVANLAREIKLIQGVLEVGLFVGWDGVQAARKGVVGGGQKPVAAYFGMADGSVVVRTARESEGSGQGSE